MMRRSVVAMACLGVVVCGGCGRREPAPGPAENLPAEPVTPSVPETPIALSESFTDPVLGVTLELPAGWSQAAAETGDDDYVVTFKKDGAAGPVVRIQAMPKTDYLLIQEGLKVEQQPAAARVKAVAKEMVAALADNKTEPEIVSDEVWTTVGIIAGRRVVAKQSDPVNGPSQGEMLIGESVGGGLYTIFTSSQPADDAGRTQAKQLLDSLSVTEPAATPPDPAGKDATKADPPVGDPADGIDAGAGADAGR